MGTKANPGQYDCYQKAEPDEPMFVLLGRDQHAPTLVWLWSILRELGQEDPAKVQEARECVVQMIEYAAKRGQKINGLGESVLAGVMELIRGANYGVERAMANNEPMNADNVRLFLARTQFETVEVRPVLHIWVNGKPMESPADVLSFDDVCRLAEYSGPRPTITYTHGYDAGGTLCDGQTITLKGDEIFCVADTSSA